jgi:hypothetical protein
LRDAIKKDWHGCLNLQNTETDIAKLLSSLKKCVTVDVKEQASVEAKNGLIAYYRISSMCSSFEWSPALIIYHLGCAGNVCG